MIIFMFGYYIVVVENTVSSSSPFYLGIKFEGERTSHKRAKVLQKPPQKLATQIKIRKEKCRRRKAAFRS